MVSMASDFAVLKLLVAAMICYVLISHADSNIIRITEISSGKVGDTYRPSQPCDKEKPTANTSESEEEQYDCESCGERKAKLNEQDIRTIRFQVVKEQILHKLQMTRPPCLHSRPKPNIESVLFATESNRNDTELAENGKDKTESAVTFPSNDNGYSCNGASDHPCANLKFSLPDDITRDIVYTTELWLYPVNNNSILKLSENIPFLPKIDLPFVIESTPNNWLKIDFGNFVNWFDSGDRLLFDVDVKCDEDCDSYENWPIALDDEKKPFLITYIRRPKVNSKNRDRRSIDCHEDTVTCCRESFRISFSELGWDNWILYPNGYKANFCKGKCMGEISISRYHHSTVIHSYIGNNNNTAAKMGLAMCCTPSKMSGIDIIYRDDKGSIFHRSLPNMVVEECDCA